MHELIQLIHLIISTARLKRCCSVIDGGCFCAMTIRGRSISRTATVSPAGIRLLLLPALNAWPSISNVGIPLVAELEFKLLALPVVVLYDHDETVRIR